MANYQEIQEALKAPLPADMLRQRTQGGQTLTFLPWYNCAKMADERAPGWSGEARVENLGDAVAVIYRISIPTDDGPVFREAIGYEAKSTSSYGDPTSNAEAMAFRRAWAKHGLGASLYGGEAIGGGAPAASGGAPVATGSSAPGWNGLLWYGSCKGKHLTDPSVDIKSLEWGANNAKNKDGSPNESQRAAIREEIARRQGGVRPQTLPIATTAPAPDAAPSAPAAKSGTAEMKELLEAAKAIGQTWADVKRASLDSFDKEPSQLTPDEVQLLMLDFAPHPF